MFQVHGSVIHAASKAQCLIMCSKYTFNNNDYQALTLAIMHNYHDQNNGMFKGGGT